MVKSIVIHSCLVMREGTEKNSPRSESKLGRLFKDPSLENKYLWFVSAKEIIHIKNIHFSLKNSPAPSFAALLL